MNPKLNIILFSISLKKKSLLKKINTVSFLIKIILVKFILLIAFNTLKVV